MENRVKGNYILLLSLTVSATLHIIRRNCRKVTMRQGGPGLRGLGRVGFAANSGQFLAPMGAIFNRLEAPNYFHSTSFLSSTMVRFICKDCGLMARA